MACLGAHVALTEGEHAALLEFEDEDVRLDYLQKVIELCSPLPQLLPNHELKPRPNF